MNKKDKYLLLVSDIVTPAKSHLLILSGDIRIKVVLFITDIINLHFSRQSARRFLLSLKEYSNRFSYHLRTRLPINRA